MRLMLKQEFELDIRKNSQMADVNQSHYQILRLKLSSKKKMCLFTSNNHILTYKNGKV